VQLLDPDLPAGAAERLLVVHDEQLVHDEAFGDPEATFALLCISKPIFALAALWMLQDLDDLGLDDEIRPYVPELDERFAGVTIRHLLTHSTGITRDATPGRWTEERFLRWIARSPVEDRSPRYSVMTSWFLLSRVLEAATGLHRGEILQRYALEPFGATLGHGAFSEHDRPRWVLDRHTGEPAAELWWADDPEIAERAWMGSALRGRASEVLRIVSALASRPRRATLEPAMQDAIALLEQPVGEGLSTDGEGLHAFGFSHGALTGHRWLGLRPGREGFGSDSGTGSFIFADPERSLAVVYLSTIVREPIASLARRRRLLDRVYDEVERDSAWGKISGRTA